MGEEFVGEDAGVALDLHEVDGQGGDFGEDGAAEGVGEGEAGVVEDEVDRRCVCLSYLSVVKG